MYDYIYKILFVGDYGVGKTSILKRYFDKNFNFDLSSTIGIDVFFETIELNDKIIKLQCWDTSGQERYREILRCYYKGSDAVVIVFDINNKKSFDNVKYWYKDINNYKKENTIMPVLLVGAKIDIERKVKYEEAKEMADNLNIEYVEVSSFDNKNIESIFLIISKEIRINKRKYEDKINQDNMKINNCLGCSNYKNTFCCIS
jgi:Ras-related protein Rab-1A